MLSLPLKRTRATPAATRALQHSQQGGNLGERHGIVARVEWFLKHAGLCFFNGPRSLWAKLSEQRHIQPGAFHWDPLSCATWANEESGNPVVESLQSTCSRTRDSNSLEVHPTAENKGTVGGLVSHEFKAATWNFKGLTRVSPRRVKTSSERITSSYGR